MRAWISKPARVPPLPVKPMAYLIPFLLPLLLAAPLPALAAEGGTAGEEPAQASARTADLKVFAYTLEHQRAVEALTRIQPLLSRRGTVELKPAENTLVVRDELASLSRIAAELRSFDHPTRPLSVEILIVRAYRSAFSPKVVEGELPRELARRLSELLPYSSYQVLAHTRLNGEEGEEVTYELGDSYRVTFRIGTVLEERRVRLYDFQIAQSLPGGTGSARRKLLHSNLNLSLGHPLALGMAPRESSDTALMLVLTPRLEEPAQTLTVR